MCTVLLIALFIIFVKKFLDTTLQPEQLTTDQVHICIKNILIFKYMLNSITKLFYYIKTVKSRFNSP